MGHWEKMRGESWFLWTMDWNHFLSQRLSCSFQYGSSAWLQTGLKQLPSNYISHIKLQVQHSITPPDEQYKYFHFISEKAEVQRGCKTCARSHSPEVELSLRHQHPGYRSRRRTGSPTSQSLTLCRWCRNHPKTRLTQSWSCVRPTEAENAIPPASRKVCVIVSLVL